MKKIRLDVDSLAVTSFDTERRPERRGTIQGAQTWVGGPCPPDEPDFTAWPSCIVKPYTGDDPNATCVDGCLGC